MPVASTSLVDNGGILLGLLRRVGLWATGLNDRPSDGDPKSNHRMAPLITHTHTAARPEGHGTQQITGCVLDMEVS